MSDQTEEGRRRLVLRNSVVEAGGYVVTQAIRLGGNLVSTRLLVPEAFGLMAIVNIVLMGLVVLSDVGILQAVVQSDKGEDEEFLNTAWTLQIVRGIGLCLTAWAIAYPISLFYEEPLLLPLVIAAGAQLLIAGFESSSLFTLRRRVNSLHLAAIEVAVQLISVVVVIGAAYVYRSVWALLLGAVAGGLLRFVWSHLINVGYRNRLRWDPEARREIMGFGRWILGSSIATFIATQSDRLIIGRLLGMSTLGVYTVALFVSEGIGAAVNRAITGVLYPVFSQLHNESPERLVEEYYFSRRWIDLVAQPALGILAMIGDLVIVLLWDGRYVDAGWMLRILCLRVALICLILPCDVCLVATGEPRFAFLRSVITMVAIVIGIPLGYHLAGALGIVWAVALSELPAFAVLWPAAARRGFFRLPRELAAVGLLLAGLLAGGGLRYFLPAV